MFSLIYKLANYFHPPALVALEKIANKYPTIGRIDLLIASLLIIIETSPLLFKTLLGKGAYHVLLEQQQTQEVYQEYLRDRKEEKLQQATIILDDYLSSIINFEQKVAKHQEKYLRLKEKSSESIHGRNIKNIRHNIERQHSQEILRFFELCDREMENYLKIISNEIKDYPHIVQGINRKMIDSAKNDNIIQHRINQYLKKYKFEEK